MNSRLRRRYRQASEDALDVYVNRRHRERAHASERATMEVRNVPVVRLDEAASAVRVFGADPHYDEWKFTACDWL